MGDRRRAGGRRTAIEESALRSAARCCAILGLMVPTALASSGCGYRAGPLTTGAYRTVAVSVFDNETFRRELERELTRAVHTELQARSSLRLVADPAAADLHLTGRILRFDERVLMEGRRNEVLSSSVVARVEVTYRAAGDETPQTRTFDAQEPYAASTGQSLRSATSELFENLAERIVYALDDGWSDPTTGRESP